MPAAAGLYTEVLRSYLVLDALEARLHLLLEQARWCLRFQRRSRWSASE